MSLLSLLTKYSNTLDGDTYFSHLSKTTDVAVSLSLNTPTPLDGDTYYKDAQLR